MKSDINKLEKHDLSWFASRVGAILLAVGLAACGGGGGNNENLVAAAAAPVEQPESKGIQCKDYDGNPMAIKPKTITIFNNSEKTIFPVIATSKNEVNEWIQGCLRDTSQPYPTKFVYKLYVNEGVGIPANSSVVLTLPLYSQLAKDSYITWWNGGRVVLADSNERLRNEPDQKLQDSPAGVSCQGQNTNCQLSVYSSEIQFPENIYAQLSEYTFGDSIIPPEKEGKPQPRLLKPENVGYNISYVDHVYLPIAIGPKNNPYIGYSGSTQALGPFSAALATFLGNDAGAGWPVYNLNRLKFPGGYNIFAQRSGVLPAEDIVPVKPSTGNPPVLTVKKCLDGQCTDDEKKNLHFGESVQRIQNLWANCADWEPDDLTYKDYRTEVFACPDANMKAKFNRIKDFFKQNHADYLKLFASGACTGIDPTDHQTPQKPVFNYWEAITHIYGWVPFNEGCGANANKLADTAINGVKTHGAVQQMYIHDLQYNYKTDAVKADPRLVFNPYVKLIHDDLSMNAYAFSVDDAVGFMSELGDGLIFTVGGPKGLENEKQFSYANGFSVNIGPGPYGGTSTQMIKKYGVCTLNQDAGDRNCDKDRQDVTMPGGQILGFRVGTVESYPIKVRFTDLNDNLYTFVVPEQFQECPDGTDLKACPPNKESIKQKIIQNCSVTTKDGNPHPKSGDWCRGADPNQAREAGAQAQLTKNYLNFPSPVNFLP